MSLRILVFYGSYRRDRVGIRLADYAVRQLAARGHDAELIDAKAVDLPMLDLMYKEYDPGTPPEKLETLATKIKAADAFLFIVGEYNWGVQAGLKNLTDHFLEEWAQRPGAILSYSAQRAGGARASLMWHGILAELGIAVVPRTITVGQIAATLSPAGEPIGEGGAALARNFPRFAADLEWWAAAAKRQREIAALSD